MTIGGGPDEWADTLSYRHVVPRMEAGHSTRHAERLDRSRRKNHRKLPPRSRGYAARMTDADELAAARTHVENIEPSDDEQIRLQRQILDFIDAHADALHRSCLIGHLTGSAIVVDPSRPATLLIHHAKLERWLQPGGHADGEGDLANVALREAEEETGLMGLRVVSPAIDIDIHEIPERGDEPAHLHLDLRFLVLAEAGSEPARDEVETLDARWVGSDDPDGLITSDEMVRLVNKGLAAAQSHA